MKKFFSKLPVMLTFVIVAVLLLGVYVGLLARPVAYGMTYSTDFKVTSPVDETNNITLTGSVSVKFKNSKQLTMKFEFDGIEMDILSEMVNGDYYYARRGHKIIMLGPVADSDYDTAIKELTDEMWNSKDEVATVNAFKFELPGINELGEGMEMDNLTCTGSIVWAVVLGVVEVVLVAFASLSVVFFVLSKKKATAPATETEQA